MNKHPDDDTGLACIGKEVFNAQEVENPREYCTQKCAAHSECTSFWIYESGSSKGRCCMKKSPGTNCDRVVANGGFYEMLTFARDDSKGYNRGNSFLGVDFGENNEKNIDSITIVQGQESDQWARSLIVQWSDTGAHGPWATIGGRRIGASVMQGFKASHTYVLPDMGAHRAWR